MSSELKWTLFVGLLATLLAAALMAFLTNASALSVLGWAVFFESLQLPLIASARRGRVDPCTQWLRRTFGAKRGGV